jgi:hypothetical protein
VVPGALYRHVQGKEQLCDLAADRVLAEVDTRPGHGQGGSRSSPAGCVRAHDVRWPDEGRLTGKHTGATRRLGSMTKRAVAKPIG